MIISCFFANVSGSRQTRKRNKRNKLRNKRKLTCTQKTPANPCTLRGDCLLDSDACPNCPTCPQPHVNTAPSSKTAALCCCPQEICAVPVPLNDGTSAGIRRSSTSSKPSWPHSFAPQANTCKDTIYRSSDNQAFTAFWDALCCRSRQIRAVPIPPSNGIKADSGASLRHGAQLVAATQPSRRSTVKHAVSLGTMHNIADTVILICLCLCLYLFVESLENGPKKAPRLKLGQSA